LEFWFVSRRCCEQKVSASLTDVSYRRTWHAHEGSVKRLVFELLPANGGLKHQPVSWQSEHHHPVAVVRVKRSALCRGNSGELRAHVKITLLKFCERFGSLKEDHFRERLSAELGSNVYLSQSGLSNRIPILIHDAFSVFASENQTTFANAVEYNEPSCTDKVISQ